MIRVDDVLTLRVISPDFSSIFGVSWGSRHHKTSGHVGGFFPAARTPAVLARHQLRRDFPEEGDCTYACFTESDGVGQEQITICRNLASILMLM